MEPDYGIEYIIKVYFKEVADMHRAIKLFLGILLLFVLTLIQILLNVFGVLESIITKAMAFLMYFMLKKDKPRSKQNISISSQSSDWEVFGYSESYVAMLAGRQDPSRL